MEWKRENKPKPTLKSAKADVCPIAQALKNHGLNTKF